MTEHYFSEVPGGELDPREITVELAGNSHSLLTAGGVFSPEHLDQGTKALLRAVADEPAPEGALLDLGCGWGPIALSAALTHPETEVWAVDINERARTLAALNAERLGLTNVRVAAPDEVPEHLSFAAIHSNPPIRVGKQALHKMLQHWLPRLTQRGSAHLVVAKHLGAESLQKWIASQFTDLTVSRVAREKGFHVIRAAR